MGMRDFLARLSEPPPTPLVEPPMADCPERPVVGVRNFLARLSELPPSLPVEPLVEPLSTAPCNGKSVLEFAAVENAIEIEDGAPFYWDIETRSVAMLGKGKRAVGNRAYAEHPSTDVLCVGFARGNGPV